LKYDTVRIGSDLDILKARQQGRTLAREIGFSGSNLTIIATAISELARNILLYAKAGELALGPIEANGHRGIAIVARDRGPGIPDIARAMQVGFSTSGSLGLGLPGAQRLMDEFEVVSEVGRGTTITAKKWLR